MGATIVKISPDTSDDRFVRWSSNSDGPTHLFTTSQQVFEYLMGDYAPNRIEEMGGPAEVGQTEVAPQIERARETGTSGRFQFTTQFRFDADTNDEIMWGQSGTFHRSKLAEVIKVAFSDEYIKKPAHKTGKRLLEMGLLTPFED